MINTIINGEIIGYIYTIQSSIDAT